MIGQSLQQNRGIVEPNLLDNLVRSIGDAGTRMESEGAGPVLLVSGMIRTFLSRLLRGRMNNFTSWPMRRSRRTRVSAW